MFYVLFFLSCMITLEDTTDRTSLTFEQADTTKAISVRTPLKSSGKILIFQKDTVLGHGSGNYFKFRGHKFILTAAHVLNHKFSSFILDGDELVQMKVIYLDKERDIAIAIPDRELQHIKAKKFRVNHKSDLVGKTIYYAGFPQDMEKCLFKGFVSKDTNGFIIMQSFALPGSSGSVVFDFWGRAVGVLSAVKVGVSGVSPFPELVETAVIVQRVDFLERDFLRDLFENENTGTL